VAALATVIVQAVKRIAPRRRMRGVAPAMNTANDSAAPNTSTDPRPKSRLAPGAPAPIATATPA
jgi:hypothetical protein